ncbi:MAG TPA: hypothetical protein VMW05_02190 [Methyloceanibacter sp.]|nr:hypothetical protein [Methyloceanibacter sp.]
MPPDGGAIGRGVGCGGAGLTGAAAMGRGAGAAGVAGVGRGAAFGLATDLRFAAGFFAADLAADFRAGAFRADFLAFRADFRAVLLRADFRAVDRRAVDFRAVERRAVLLRAVERRAVLLRAVFLAVFRFAGRFAVLRAVFRFAVLRAVLFRAVFRFAVFRAVLLRAVFRAVFLTLLRAVLRAGERRALVVRRRAVLLRADVFFFVVRFFPVDLVAIVSLRFCLDVAINPFNRRVHRITLHLVQACRPTWQVNYFFQYMQIAAENGNLASTLCRTSTTNSFQAHHDAPQTVHRTHKRFALLRT